METSSLCSDITKKKSNQTMLYALGIFFFFVQGIENDFINIQENYTSRVQLHF